MEFGAAMLLAFWGFAAVRAKAAEIHWNPVYWPLLGLGSVALAQQLFGLTIYPYATKVELLKWGATLLLIFLFTEALRTAIQAERFVWFLACLSFAVSLFAIVQHFTFNGRLYWWFPLPEGAGPFGPFVDRNHFAGFIELTVPLNLALIVRRTRERETLVLLGLFTVISIGALFLSASRGGIISFLFEAGLMLFLLRARPRGTDGLLGAAAVGLVAVAFVGWLGWSETLERFSELTAGDFSHDRRISMYRDTWKLFEDSPWTGTGLGTLVVAYPRYESYYDGRIVDHAHNDYLELLAETGIAGGLCGLAFVLVLVRSGLRNLARSGAGPQGAVHAGALAGCAGILMHSLVDFNLHIPSNALLFLLLAVLATSLIESQDCAEERIAQAIPY
jgi:O-antigen ligase